MFKKTQKRRLGQVRLGQDSVGKSSDLRFQDVGFIEIKGKGLIRLNRFPEQVPKTSSQNRLLAFINRSCPLKQRNNTVKQIASKIYRQKLQVQNLGLKKLMTVEKVDDKKKIQTNENGQESTRTDIHTYIHPFINDYERSGPRVTRVIKVIKLVTFGFFWTIFGYF